MIWQTITKARTFFFFFMKPTDSEEGITKGMITGILLVAEDVKEPLPVFYNDVGIVIEEKVIILHLHDVPNAFANLIGLMYILNLNYPKDLRCTFEVIQRLFMGVGVDSCIARIKIFLKSVK
uniref:Uncharacterized protein n=1 Tax=Amphilophus citrinellus TaxID=61819 RepID=A0A3Q0RDX7_AMPCI